MNYLLIESLQKFHYYFGDSFTVEYPTGSGQRRHLADVAAELSVVSRIRFCAGRMADVLCTVVGRTSSNRIPLA